MTLRHLIALAAIAFSATVHAQCQQPGPCINGTLHRAATADTYPLINANDLGNGTKTVSTASQLSALLNASTGDLATTQDTKLIYQYNGTTWVPLPGAAIANLGNTTEGQGADLIGSGVKRVPTFAAVRALTILTTNQQLFVDQCSSTNNWGGGEFVYVASETRADDGGVVLVDTIGRHWDRVVGQNQPIYSAWYCLTADGSTDDTTPLGKFLAALNYAPLGGQTRYVEGVLQAGKIRFTSTETLPSGTTNTFMTLRGQGVGNTELYADFITTDAIVVPGNLTTIRDLSVTSSAARTAGGGTGRGIAEVPDHAGAQTNARNQIINVQVSGHPGDGVYGERQELSNWENVWSQSNGGYCFNLNDSDHGVGTLNTGINNVITRTRAGGGSAGCGNNGYRVINQIGTLLDQIESLQNNTSTGNTEVQVTGSNNVIRAPDVERTDGLHFGLVLGGSENQLVGGFFNQLNIGVQGSSATNGIISRPRCVGLGGTPMANCINLDSNTHGFMTAYQNNPAFTNVTSPYFSSASDNYSIDSYGVAQGAQFRSFATTETCCSPTIDARGGGVLHKLTASGNVTWNNPTNLQTGDRIVIVETQDGTGGRSNSFGTLFANRNWTDTGNAAGTTSSVEFIYDGSTLQQVGAQVPWH